MSGINVTIDEKNCVANSGETILSVAKRYDIEIPTLCFHPSVSVYGACGICLVEVEGNKKLLRACATEVWEGMKVHTKSERAEKARKLALELLFSDHTGDCLPPCMNACPAHTHCQGYVGLIADGEYDAALALIKEQIPLPASIGRVCPHPCESACRRKLAEEAISIAALKSFAADWDLGREESYLPEKQPPTGKRVAIVGAGPAGLTMAYYLAIKGHSADIYEAMPQAGGMLRYGIPEYRLPKAVLDREIALIEKLGVKIRCNVKIGKDIAFESLEKEYDAVYLAIGAWQSAPLRCEGEQAEGVLGGIDFLRRAVQDQPTSMGRRVAVIGGGNTAMDACRTAIRLGAEKVYVLYRRTRSEMPAEDIEIVEAMEEGVEFKFLVAPIRILTENGHVAGIELQQMELGEPDDSGRRRPVPVEGKTETLALDTVIAAIGQKVVAEGLPVKLTDWNTIAADAHTYLTDRKGVFAGGDGINRGPGIAVESIGHARECADIIDSYLNGDLIPRTEQYLVKRDDLTAADFADREKLPRVRRNVIPPEIRRTNFEEVASTITEEQAKAEAARCLECGCADYGECDLIKYGQRFDVRPDRFGAEPHRRNGADDMVNVHHNPDKCVLCGLCVRYSDEHGDGSLGLIGRGFDTQVRPDYSLSKPEDHLEELKGCAEICPTGALIEKTTGKKVNTVMRRQFVK